MRESRLFKIVYYLLEKGKTTVPVLAERLEVSARTVYRDIDALSAAGIPVYVESGRNGGVRLMSDFVLDKAILSETEKQEVLTALQVLGNIHCSDGESTLIKLSSVFNIAGNDDNWLEVDFSCWSDKQDDNEKFEQLKSAVINRKAVIIKYANSSEVISKRKIYPLKLYYKSKAWYLKAYCTLKKDYRIFKLTRIFDFKLLDETFSPRSYPENTAEQMPELIKIVLRFPNNMAYRVYDEFSPDEVTAQENGDFIVNVNFPQSDWIIGYLLSFGTQVEIIEPLCLKDVIAEQAQKIYENNKT